MLKLGELLTVLKVDQDEFNRRLKQSHKDFEGFGDKLKASAMVAAGAVAVALGAGLLGALDEMDVGAKVAANLGLTDTKAAGEMGRLAGQIYGDNFGESVAEAGDALMGIQRFHLVAEDADANELKKIAEQALTLSSVFGQDMPKAMSTAQQMIRNGLAKDATEAFDLITRGIQEGADKSGDLLDTFNEYPTVLRDLGLNGVQSLGLIQQGLKGGARDADTVADALKEFAIRGQDASTSSAAGFKALGINAKNATADIAAGGDRARTRLAEVLNKLKAMKDPVARNAAAVALFGTKAEDLGDALFNMDLDTAADGFGNLAGATDRAAATVGGTAGAQVEQFKRQVKLAFIDTMAKAIPYLKQAADWGMKHKDVLIPLVAALGTFAVVIGIIVAIAKVATAVQIAWNIAMMANPVGLIILAIILLIAGIVLLWKNWDTIWGWIKSAAAAVGKWFMEVLWGKYIKGAINFVIGSIKNWWNFFSKIPGNLKNLFLKVAGFITAPFRNAFNSVAGMWNNTIGQMRWTVPNWVPFIGGNTISAPQLPMLAKGGVIDPVVGGRLMIAGEGRDREIVTPDKLLRQIVAGELAKTGGGAGGFLRILLEGTGIMRGVRREVRLGGGQTQTVLVGR